MHLLDPKTQPLSHRLGLVGVEQLAELLQMRTKSHDFLVDVPTLGQIGDLAREAFFVHLRITDQLGHRRLEPISLLDQPLGRAGFDHPQRRSNLAQRGRKIGGRRFSILLSQFHHHRKSVSRGPGHLVERKLLQLVRGGLEDVPEPTHQADVNISADARVLILDLCQRVQISRDPRVVHLDGATYTGPRLIAHPVVNGTAGDALAENLRQIRFPALGPDRQPKMGVKMPVVDGAHLHADDSHRRFSLYLTEACHAADHRIAPVYDVSNLSISGTTVYILSLNVIY